MSVRFGRYETIQPIASGGMATVYVGRAVGAGGFERRVAVKVMHAHIAEDPDFVKMFLDEARLAARIHHPNVVSTLDVQKTDEGMFLVMEFVQGASLAHIARKLKKQKQRMPLGVAIRIMLDALSGLHAAHELCGKDNQPLNLVHRDVSPHNILVGSDGICRITDFGVARAQARLTTTRGGQLKGKLAYMAPEQAKGDEMDRRADVYAAGIVLWESLTGHRCFKAEHDGQLIGMVLEGVKRRPREVNKQIPVEIDDVCMHALTADPAERFDSAATFLVALEDAAERASIRIPSSRQLAAFVQQFKLELKSLPPPELSAPPPELGEVESPASSTNTHTMEGTIPEASLPLSIPTRITGTNEHELDAEGIDPPSANSQLTGIGAVHSQRPGELARRPRTTVFVVAGALAVLGLIAVVAMLGKPDGSNAAKPATSAAAVEPAPATSEPVPPPTVPEASASAAASAAPPTASESAEPSAPPSASATARPIGGGRTFSGGKPGSGRKGPLGYEPDSL